MSVGKIKLVSMSVTSHILNSILALFFFYFGAKLLNPEQFGELRTMMAILPILMAFTLSGYDSIILRNTNLGITMSLLKIFYLRFLLALIISLALMFYVGFYAEGISDSLKFFLIIVAITLPFFETSTGYKNYLLATQLKNKGARIFLIVRASSLILFLLGFVAFYFDVDVRLILFNYLFAMSIPSLIAFFVVSMKQRKSQNKKLNPNDILGVKSAFFITTSALVYTLAYSLDKLFIRYELGAETLALYSVLMMFPLEAAKLCDIIIPLFYKKLFLSKKQLNRKFTLHLFYLGVLGVIVYVFAFYWYSGVVFGSSYVYDFITVSLSGVVVFSLSFEFFNNHRIFVKYGSGALLKCSVLGMFFYAIFIPIALNFSGLNGLIIVLISKQFIVPYSFTLAMEFSSEKHNHNES